MPRMSKLNMYRTHQAHSRLLVKVTFVINFTDVVCWEFSSSIISWLLEKGHLLTGMDFLHQRNETHFRVRYSKADLEAMEDYSNSTQTHLHTHLGQWQTAFWNHNVIALARNQNLNCYTEISDDATETGACPSMAMQAPKSKTVPTPIRNTRGRCRD